LSQTFYVQESLVKHAATTPQIRLFLHAQNCQSQRFKEGVR
jgi:hypothetical protein